MKIAERLESLLPRVQEASNDINAAIDNLNVEIESLQKHFAAMKLGVSAFLPLSPRSTNPDLNRVLSFEKEGGDWLFYVTEYRGSECVGRVPLLRASKGIRTEVATHLPELLETMLDTTFKQVSEIAEATKTLKFLGSEIDRALRAKR